MRGSGNLVCGNCGKKIMSVNNIAILGDYTYEDYDNCPFCESHGVPHGRMRIDYECDFVVGTVCKAPADHKCSEKVAGVCCLAL